ncbi:MAG: hypothetical protein EXX96DRAFT_566594 [Benjaminiella poitrasii]|nr:MAG: hypothetical protein EXX96DRAFT_566594 [Benjaminiella poitrasii]
MSTLSTILLSIVLTTAIILLFAYVIGLLMPASHIVSRTSKFEMAPTELWSILVDVARYPTWQPKIKKVTIEDAEAKQDTVVFVEHSSRNRHTIFVHHEREPNRCLVRILEERLNSQRMKKVPTFSGSWTFELSQEREEEKKMTMLKITEQGVIQQPIVRFTHLLFFGFHRRLDRFMHDLHVLVDQRANNKSEATAVEEQEGETSKSLFESVLETSDHNHGQAVDDPTSVYQQVETNDVYSSALQSTLSLGEPKAANEKDWDFMSEIYERTQ